MLNTKGAAARFGCSTTWIHQLVKKGSLPAYAFNESGVLAPIDASASLQGKDIYFKEEEIAAYRPAARGRPMGAPDKVGDNPKRHRKRSATGGEDPLSSEAAQGKA